MGLILDSSLLIAGERRGWRARQVVADIAKHFPGEELALSVVTITELAHGIARADSAARKAGRSCFVEELTSALQIYSVTPSIALRAGLLDGENAIRGIRLDFTDLLIGVTALELNYRVATRNVRHFNMVPGLGVISF